MPEDVIRNTSVVAYFQDEFIDDILHQVELKAGEGESFPFSDVLYRKSFQPD